MKHYTLIDKAFLLKRSTPFSSLDLDLLLSIADKLAHVRLEQGDCLFSAGEEGSRLYFVASGRIALMGKDEKVIVGTGDFFGEEALFNNAPRAYTAAAVEDTECLTLSRSNLATIIAECPSVAMGFLYLYARLIPLRPRS